MLQADQGKRPRCHEPCVLDQGLKASSAIVQKSQAGNISNIQVVSRDLDFYKFNIDLEVRNLSHLNQIIAAIRLSHFVESVQRGKD